MMFRIIFIVLLGTILTSAQVKPGFCPSPLGSSYTGVCGFNCRSDNYCLFGLKCCPTLCGGNQCAVPEASEPVTTTTPAPTTKSGSCPAPYFPTKDSCYLTPQVANCVKDADCTGSQKCCSNGCVLTCRNPTTVSGFCPASLGLSATGLCLFTCKTDKECLLGTKCCPTKCGGNQCAIPLKTEPTTTTTPAPTVKTGDCPAPTYSTRESCFLTPQVANCVKDAECTGNQKCCSNGCVLSCKTPANTALVKSGFCPSPFGYSYTGLCSFACKTDSNCLFSSKCCPTKCGGNECSFPLSAAPVTTTTPAPATRTGTCPAPTYTNKDQCFTTVQYANCVKDADCSGTQKCCTNGCVLTCKAV